MLRKLRITLAAVFFTFITLLFLDFTGTLHTYFTWMTKVQFLPALLSLNFVIVAVLLVLTLVFGRVYCSIVCPLGVMQDIISCTHDRKKNRFHFSQEKRWLRYSVFVIFVSAIFFGINAFVALLDPNGAYGRIATNILQPVYLWCNNGIAYIAERVDSYAFYSADVWLKSFSSLIVALLTLFIIGVIAWRNGRTYCNTICPVGTLLSFFARFSLLKIRIQKDKCVNCGQCSRNCKAACIDFQNHAIDYSRCVACGNCLEHCHTKALVYSMPKRGKTKEKKPTMPDESRRAFLLGTALATTTMLFAQEQEKVDGGLALIEDKVAPKRHTPITPPGAYSARNFQHHCTACQLCVSTCPNNVLRPSTDLKTFMQPTMSYEKGYCRVECNTCSTVCPTGAISPITLEEKASTQIGHAVWIKQNCVVVNDKQQCWACAGRCPAGAISMVPFDEHSEHPLLVPSVNPAKCIGCGACEHLCPARPLSAIYVEGHEVHREI